MEKGMIERLKRKYESFPIQVRASFWFLMCSFLQKGISFITTPIFTRLLSTEEYGQFSVFNSWFGILIVFVTINLYSGVYTRGLVKYEEDRKVFSSSLQGLTLTLVLVWTVVYLIFKDFINGILGLTTLQMLLMLLMMWTSAAFSFWAMEQRVEYKYQKLVLVTLLVSFAKPLLGILFVSHAEDKVSARIISMAVVEVICYSCFFWIQMRNGKKFFSKKYWKHVLVFNIPLIPHYLSTSILNSADRIMIERMVDSSSAGIYSLAYSLSMIMTMFNLALIQTIEPWMYKKIKEKRVTDISSVAYPAFFIIACVNIILIAFAPEAISLFAPSEYHNAIYVVPPIAMSVFFMFSYSFFAVFEFYYEKTKLVAIATSAGAVLNVLLNYIFIDIWGYYAAGYTTLVCYILYAILHYYFMQKICKKELSGVKPYNIGIYLSIASGFMIVGFIFLLTYKHTLIRYALIAFFIIIFLLMRKRACKFIRMVIGGREEDK